MKRFMVLVFLLWFAGLARAQVSPLPTQQSSSAEGYHVFGGTKLYGLIVAWHATTTARYLMVFDGTALPSDGSTTACTAAQGAGCLAACFYVGSSVTAPNEIAVDYTTHPIKNRNGVTVALSSGAGCGTLTVDGANDYFYGQVQ